MTDDLSYRVAYVSPPLRKFPSVIPNPCDPSAEEVKAYCESHWECETRAEARYALRQEKMRALAKLAEETLPVREGMSEAGKAALGNIVAIGTGR
jgi:hypothetical protein